MSWVKSMSGCGDSGAELTMTSEDEGRSLSSSSQPQPPLTPRAVQPPLKEPWVPAPGRTSKVRSHSFSSVMSSHVEQGASYNEPIEVPPVKTLTAEKSSSSGLPKEKRKGRSRTKRSRSIDERKFSGFTLQTKDSLVNVTACLNKRRDEVFQLWEKHVLSCDAALLGELENANMLAVEAANDVAELRKSIDDLKKKSGKISEEDNKGLDLLRGRILSKLTLFEASHDQIQKRLRESRDSSKNPKSRNSSAHAKSIGSEGNFHESVHSDKSEAIKEEDPLGPVQSSLIYLKEKSKTFSDAGDDTEVDADFEDFDEPMYPVKQSVKFDLEPPQAEETHHSKERKRMESEDRGRNQKESVGSRSPGRRSTFEEMNPTILVDSIYYRDKIRGLHKKLMDQQATCIDMKRAMKRIESQNEFDIKLLKSNMKAQVDDLGHLPEMLEFTEDRLNESLHARFAIESSLQMKTNELNMLKNELGRLGKDLDGTEAKLVTVEAKNEALTEKLERLEVENKELRMEVWNKNQLLASLESNMNSQSKAKGNDDEKDRQSQKLLLLEDKIGELEMELETANKETVAMKRARNEISTRLTKRIDELMDTLDVSRAKNRSLQNQIKLVKTRYFQLFVSPVESNQNIFPETIKVLAEANIGNDRGGSGSP